MVDRHERARISILPLRIALTSFTVYQNADDYDHHATELEPAVN